MATTSEVKTGLDAIAQTIASQRNVVKKAVANAALASAALADLTTTYADLVTTVNGYGTTNAFEASARAELAKLTSEFQALKATADGIAATQV